MAHHEDVGGAAAAEAGHGAEELLVHLRVPTGPWLLLRHAGIAVVLHASIRQQPEPQVHDRVPAC